MIQTCYHAQMSPLRESQEVFGPGVNFQEYQRWGEDIWELTLLQPKLSFWIFTCLVCSSFNFASLYLITVTNCTLQAVFPPDIHATTIKICCLIPGFHNEPEIFYRLLNFWFTWYETTQWDTHIHTHIPEQRFEAAAAFLLAQGRGTLVSWTGGLPDKQQVALLLTTTF